MGIENYVMLDQTYCAAPVLMLLILRLYIVPVGQSCTVELITIPFPTREPLGGGLVCSQENFA